MNNAAPKQIDLGNNETVSIGVDANHNGTFTALTFVESKTFKTRAGAVKWLARRGFAENGERVAR